MLYKYVIKIIVSKKWAAGKLYLLIIKLSSVSVNNQLVKFNFKIPVSQLINSPFKAPF